MLKNTKYTDNFIKIRKEDVFHEFRHYIEQKKYNIQQLSDSQDTLHNAGECKEAEIWLKLFGVNLDDNRVRELTEGRRLPFSLDLDLLKATDNDFVLITANSYVLGNIRGYLVAWLNDNKEELDNIDGYILFVPELKLWSESAKKNILRSNELKEVPKEFDYALAALEGPKVSLFSFSSTDHGPWKTMSTYKTLSKKLHFFLSSADQVILSEMQDFHNEMALSRILT